MVKLHDQKQLREERVYFIYTSGNNPSLRKNHVRNSHRAGTWRQELMQRPWRSAAYWLAPHGLLNLLSSTTQDHQSRGGTTGKCWTLPCKSPIKKMPSDHLKSMRWILSIQEKSNMDLLCTLHSELLVPTLFLNLHAASCWLDHIFNIVIVVGAGSLSIYIVYSIWFMDQGEYGWES